MGNLNKVRNSIKDAIINSGLKSGMSVSFHHHLRNGDYVMQMVFDEIAKLEIKNLSLYASSLGEAQNGLAPYILDGTITNISCSGVRGKIGEIISEGKIKNPVVIRSHGGRARAIEEGDIKIDVAFIAASSSDSFGNASGIGGKSNCGVLSYANVDSKYAKHVVIVTDTLLESTNPYISIEGENVESVVVVDKIGDPNKIATKEIRFTTNPKEKLIAKNAVDVILSSPDFKDGFNYQAGAGGVSIGVFETLKRIMKERNIHMGCAIGGITGNMVSLLEEGYIEKLYDAQDFDIKSISSIGKSENHKEVSTSLYANPNNPKVLVNKLDFVVLGALEVDVNFNVNVIIGSDGLIKGAPGGHPDASAGSKNTIIVTPLNRGRIPCIVDNVVAITTPGSSVDVVVTEVGIAVNPNRVDIIEQLTVQGIKCYTIEELRDKAYGRTGKPDPIDFTDEVVALIEYRDGSVIDKIYKLKNKNN